MVPAAEIVAIRVSEDEVAARTFEVTATANGKTVPIFLVYFYEGSRWSVGQSSQEALQSLEP